MAVSAPVLSSQSTHTFKLPGVVRDNNQSPAACVTGNHLIEWPDRASLTGKLCPDLPRMGGGRRVIIQNIKSGTTPLSQRDFFRASGFFGTVISSIRVTELIHILPWFRLKRSLTLAGCFIVKMQMLVSSINFSIRMIPVPAQRVVPGYP